MGKVKSDSNAVFKNIIKKENGVNPFLTVMNFKISYKTWLKYSRKSHVDHDSARSSHAHKVYLVPVDIETIVEHTSDEEVPEIGQVLQNKMLEIKRKATMQFNKSMVVKKDKKT